MSSYKSTSALLLNLILLITLNIFSHQAFSQTQIPTSIEQCMAPASTDPLPKSIAGQLTTFAVDTVVQQIWPCIVGVLQGAWDATGGLVSSAANCVLHPIQCANQAADAFRNGYQFLTNIVTELQKVGSALSHLKTDELIQLVCAVVGEIGTDILMAVLTVGAASGKLGLTVAKIVTKILKIAEVVKKFAGIPVRVLGKLTDDVLDKLEHLVGTNQNFRLRNYLDESCLIN
jgi:hypothetical protein